MSSDWYAYKTKGGHTLFFYNTKTGKHIWANDCNGLQFEFSNNGFEDHNENCAISKEKCEENPSDWRPYHLKSGDALFYYNIITGEHKWDMNFDLSNSSSIPSEPVILKDDTDCEMSTSECWNVDQNGNTILTTAVKKETSEKEPCCFAKTEADIQSNSTIACQPENSQENQFERELNSIETNSNFMALRSTVQRRNSISYENPKEASLQEDSSEEYFSDTTSSSGDDCSNFSDELPEISASESEEEQVEDERARKNRRKSKYDVENLTGSVSRAQYSDGLVQRRENNLAPEKQQSSSFLQNGLASLSESSPGTDRVTTDQDKTGFVKERILNRYEQEERSTGQNRLPKIDGIFSIANSSNQGLVKKANFEKYKESIDGTNLNSQTSSLDGNNSPTNQNTTSSLELNLSVVNNNSRSSCSLPGINNHQCMPTIEDVFSLPNNTTNLVVTEVNYEKGNQNIDTTILSIYQPDSKFDYEATQLAYRKSRGLQENINPMRRAILEEEQETPKLCNETTCTLRNNSSTASNSMRMARSGEDHLESISQISSPVKEIESEGRQSRESEDMSASRDVDDDDPRSRITGAMQNMWETGRMQTDRDCEQDDDETYSSRPLESKGKSASNSSLASILETIGKGQDQVKEAMDRNHGEQVSGNYHQDEDSCTGSKVRMVGIPSSDETSSNDHQEENSCTGSKVRMVGIPSSDETSSNDHQEENSCTGSKVRMVGIPSSDGTSSNDDQDENTSTGSKVGMVGIPSSDETSSNDHQEENSCTGSKVRMVGIPSSDGTSSNDDQDENTSTGSKVRMVGIPSSDGTSSNDDQDENTSTGSKVRMVGIPSSDGTSSNDDQDENTSTGSKVRMVGIPSSDGTSSNDHQDENTSTGSKVGMVGIPSSDETLPRNSTIQDDPALNQKEQANPANMKYRYHYSIKCLLPMIDSTLNEAETGSPACHNRRPAMILRSQYLSMPSTTEPIGPVTAVSNDKGDSLRSCVTAGNASDPQIGTTNGSEPNEEFTSLPAPAIKQEPSETNQDIFRGSWIKTSMLPNSSCFANGCPLQTSRATTFGNGLNGDLSSLECFGARSLNGGLPTVTENVDSRYKCYYCDKDFSLQEELRRHLALRHLLFGGVFLCNSCDDSFVSHDEFYQHLLLHDEVKPVKCRHCETEFVTVEELASHISSHVDEPKYPKYAKRREALELVGTDEIEHQDRPSNKTNNSQEEDKPEKRRRCTYCDQDFRHYFALRLHLRTHGKTNNHSCLLCGKRYLDLKSLRKHVVIHLREKRLECNVCHKTFRFHSDYLQHQLIHVPGQLFRCEKRGCREIFKTWDELRQHEIAIHEEKRYRCTQCGKSFSKQEKLIWHFRLHTGEKPLECVKCGKRFRTRVILRNHERIHLDSKEFKCNVCDKGFKQKCSMLRHLKTHSAGPKEHPCSLCKKRFTQSCSLQRHLRIHSGEKFKCPKCPMKFLEAWRMRVHIKSNHSGE